MKANSCDCVQITWSDLELMKISRDEANPVQRIIEQFADFQINQRELKEAQNELEVTKKTLTALRFIFNSGNTSFSDILGVNAKTGGALSTKRTKKLNA